MQIFLQFDEFLKNDEKIRESLFTLLLQFDEFIKKYFQITNDEKFVKVFYILAILAKYRSPYNLTIFLKKKCKIPIS